MTERWIAHGISMLEEEFGANAVRRAVDAVARFELEVPSWAFGPFGGGRFGGYTPPAGARTIEEKLDDAAMVHSLTGATPRVASHVLWDFSKDGVEPDFELARKAKQAAVSRGIDLGAVNPTYFLAGSYRGSFAAPEKHTRDRYVRQTVFASRVAAELGNRLVTLWFPDGSAYPGQIELQDAYLRMKESLAQAVSASPAQVSFLIEYKVFEPGTYSTTIPDWGAAFALARGAGKNCGVLIDLGHHHHGTNIEQIVAMLIAEGIPAGFHFNTRYAADDDHAVEPNQEMARIFRELVKGGVVANADAKRNWAYMIDQCSGRENRIHAVLHSVDSLMVSLARGCLVEESVLADLQNRDEVILANRCLNRALLHADVRPIVARARLEKGLPADPVAAYAASGYQQKIEAARK